jgi:hypothetical protein
LENLNMTALQRQLRDKRFDMPVAKAITEGKRLKPDPIDRFVGQYHATAFGCAHPPSPAPRR